MQALYIFLGILSFGFFAFFMSFLAPVLGSPYLAILDTLGALLFIGFILYAITKHRLLHIDLVWRYIVEYLVYITISIGLFLSIGFVLFTKNFDPFLVFAILVTLMIIIIPQIHRIIIKYFHSLLMKKYNKIWDTLKQIANDGKTHYEFKDIIKIITIDVPEALPVANAKYHKLQKTGNFVLVLLDDEITSQPIFSRDNILIKHLEKTKSYVYKDYLKEEEKEIKDVLEKYNIAITFPISFNNELVGVVTYGVKHTGDVFHKEEIKLLEDIIKDAEKQIGNVLQLSYMSSDYAEQALKKYKSTEQMQLLKATKHMGVFDDIKELAYYICELSNRTVNAKYTYIYLYDEKKRAYVLMAVIGKNNLPKIIKEQHYLVKYLRQRNEIIVCDKLDEWAKESRSKDFEEASKLAKKLNATLIAPFAYLTLLGFVIVGEKNEEDKTYTKDDLMLLSFIADKAESTISNILVREKAERDDLTGLHNKGYLDRRVKEEVASSLKECQPVSYVITDADDFKWFNENHSHADGDKVLKAIADAIKSVIRPTDEFGRFGGEEFPILVTGKDRKTGVIVANKVLEAIRTNERIQELSKKYGHKISVSIGVSCFDPEEAVDELTNEEIYRISEALFMRADKSLKEAKKKGKDQVVVSKSFRRGEEGENKDLYNLRTLIITEGKEYGQMRIDGLEIETKADIEDGLKSCRKYDIV
ncbi:GGDEF domain-containing protein, partial [bacterium]